METIFLGKTNIAVSRLCVGGCPMGEHGWGQTNTQDFVDLIHEALESGINFFDTADTYGLGKSEETLGKCLKGKRKRAVIATKFGVRVEKGKSFYDNSPKWIETALEKSLKRLQTDYVDLYQIHYWDEATPMEEIVKTLEKAKQAGKIRAFGLSNMFKEQKEMIAPFAPFFDCLQNEYSLANRSHEADLRLYSEMFGMTSLLWGSLGQGILTGKYDENSVFDQTDRRSREIYVNFHGKKLKKNLEIVAFMRQIAPKYQRPLSAVALRFILDFLPDSVVLAGMKNAKQLEDNMLSLNWELTGEDLEGLNQISKS